jgi:hypothetical protein
MEGKTPRKSFGQTAFCLCRIAELVSSGCDLREGDPLVEIRNRRVVALRYMKLKVMDGER